MLQDESLERHGFTYAWIDFNFLQFLNNFLSNEINWFFSKSNHSKFTSLSNVPGVIWVKLLLWSHNVVKFFKLKNNRTSKWVNWLFFKYNHPKFTSESNVPCVILIKLLEERYNEVIWLRPSNVCGSIDVIFFPLKSILVQVA